MNEVWGRQFVCRVSAMLTPDGIYTSPSPMIQEDGKGSLVKTLDHSEVIVINKQPTNVRLHFVEAAGARIGMSDRYLATSENALESRVPRRQDDGFSFFLGTRLAILHELREPQ